MMIQNKGGGPHPKMTINTYKMIKTSCLSGKRHGKGNFMWEKFSYTHQ